MRTREQGCVRGQVPYLRHRGDGFSAGGVRRSKGLLSVRLGAECKYIGVRGGRTVQRTWDLVRRPVGGLLTALLARAPPGAALAVCRRVLGPLGQEAAATMAYWKKDIVRPETG